MKVEDLSLLGDVNRVCGEVVRLEREKEQEQNKRGGGENGGKGRKARVDWLVMSQSNSVQSFKGRRREFFHPSQFNSSTLHCAVLAFLD